MVILLLLSVLLIALFSLPVVQTSLAKIITNKVNKKYNTNIVVKKVDLSFLGNIKLKKIQINDHHNDSLIYIDRLTTSVFDYKTLLDNKFEFGAMELEGVYFYMKTYKDEKDDNLTVFVDKLDSNSSPSSGTPFLLTTSKINLKNVNYYLYDKNKQENTIAFYENINGDIEDFKIKGPNVYANIRALSLIEDHGIAITNLSTDFTYTKSKMTFIDTKLETENSSIDAQITFDYKREDLRDFNNKVNIEADFTKANVSLIDLHKFYDELGENDKVNFTTKVKGTLNSFTLNDLKLVSNRNSTINGTFYFKNAVNTENGFSLNAHIYNLSSNYQNLKQLLPNILGKTLPSTFEKLGRFNINGQSFITNELVDAKLTVISDIGKTVSSLKLTNIDDIDNAKYTGNVEFIDLEFGKIVNDSLIGKMSLIADVDGSGFTLENVNTSIKGNISKHQYKGYTYNDIDINGLFKNQLFDGSLIARDKNLIMNFKGLADLSSDVYKFDFVADVGFSNFNKLNLFKRDEIAILKGKIDIKVKGNTLDNLAGEIDFSNASYTNQNDNYYFKDFKVTSVFQDSTRTITINSTDIVDGRVKGSFKFNELGKLAINSLGSIYTNYNPTSVTDGQFLDFNFKIYNKIVDVFFPEVKLGSNTSIKGKINSDKQKFELTVKSPKVEAYQNIVENIRLQIDNKNPLYNTLLSVDKVNTKHYNIADLNLVNVTLNDTLFFRTDFVGGKSLKEKFDLSFYHTINENNMSVIGLKKSNINFKDNIWLINPNNNKQNKVVFDKALHTFAFDKVKVFSEDQAIDFAGVISGKNNKDITLNLKDVKLEGITPLIDKFTVKGLVNGSINYKQNNGEVFPLANLTINNFYANDFEQGDLKITAKGFNSINQYAIEASLENKNRHGFLVNGELDFSNNKTTILANYAFDKFNLNILNPLGEDVINNIRGKISGDGIISGLLENPDINGHLYLENTGFSIPYLNVNYDLIGKPKVLLSNQTFNFSPTTTLLDVVHDTEATLYGSITHNKFEKWWLDLTVDTDNLLVLNTEEQEDMEYYGTAYMDGNATIKGRTDELVIEVEGKTKKGTEFIIPLNDVSTIGDSRLINFITQTEKGIDNNQQQDIIFDIVKGLTLNFGLEVTDEAIVEVVVDKNTGSILRGTGNGYMAIEINTNGKFEINGTYIVSDGIYEFRNIVNKDFKVQPNGKVIWNGNPFDAYLDIEAIYSTKANPSVLLENVNNNRKIDVDLIAKITGQLLNSEIDFDVKLPDQSSVINSELEFKLKDEYTKMTQFFSILAAGSFVNVDEGILGINSNAAINSTISEKIASVLSGIIKSKGDKFELGLTYDIASRDDVRSFNLNDQLGISVSTKIGERLIINGKFGVPVGANTHSNIIGEVEVALPLNKEGTLNAKAYSRQNDIEYDVTDVEGYTQGIGLSWSVDFDNAKELKEKIFKRKKKNPKLIKKKDSLEQKRKLVNFITKKNDSIKK